MVRSTAPQPRVSAATSLLTPIVALLSVLSPARLTFKIKFCPSNMSLFSMGLYCGEVLVPSLDKRHLALFDMVQAENKLPFILNMNIEQQL